MRPYRSYIVCASSRSGSTLLCKSLAATGVAGQPDSYFHQTSIEAWVEALKLRISENTMRQEVLCEIFKAAIEKGTAGTGVFGLRLMRKSFDFFIKNTDILYPGLPSDAARLETAFGPTLYIHLSRQDKVAQAVSLVKASQTGLWHRAPDGTELERTAAPGKLHYDVAGIRRHVAALTGFDAEWDDWFEREGIRPLRLSYEELSADPRHGVARVLEALGLDPLPAKRIVPEVGKLADEISRDWIARYRAAESDQTG